MTLTAEDTLDAEQEGGKSEGLTVDAYGPFNSTEHTRERCEGQAAITTTSNVPRTETDIAMERNRTQTTRKTTKGLQGKHRKFPPHPRRTTTVPPTD
jgi:hypothetical protein